MSQIAPLLATLKRELKSRGLTYADVAAQLKVSESSIKRMFSASRLNLDPLEQLCQLLGLEISDLVQKMMEQRSRITTLTEEQEREVVDDPKLLLMAISVLNNWTYSEIIDAYLLTEHEAVRLLATLDRLKIIDLLPQNRLRLIVAADFRWLPNGPIQRFFREQVQPEFLHSTFSAPGEVLLFRSGMLSRASNAVMTKKMERLLEEFSELHNEDAGLPLAERFGSSILLAMRPWELGFFRQLRRNPDEKVFKLTT